MMRRPRHPSDSLEQHPRPRPHEKIDRAHSNESRAQRAAVGAGSNFERHKRQTEG